MPTRRQVAEAFRRVLLEDLPAEKREVVVRVARLIEEKGLEREMLRHIEKDHPEVVRAAVWVALDVLDSER